MNVDGEGMCYVIVVWNYDSGQFELNFHLVIRLNNMHPNDPKQTFWFVYYCSFARVGLTLMKNKGLL